jgi:hypothetical protein
MQLALTDRERIVRVLLTWSEPEPPPVCPVCNKRDCKISHAWKIEDKPKIKETVFTTENRDERDRLNRQAMVDLMLTHNITIPARQFDKWRPTERTTGSIDGVSDGLECIMTDGMLGYFLRGDREPLLGHVGHFIWDKAKITLVKYIDDLTGEEKYATVTAKRGAPPTLYSLSNTSTDNKPKVRKSKPKSEKAIKRQRLIDNM